MTQPQFITRPCTSCAGTGSKFDATLADKVCTNGVGTVQCSACQGTGTRKTLAPNPEHVEAAKRLAAAALPDWDDNELPDWMIS